VWFFVFGVGGGGGVGGVGGGEDTLKLAVALFAEGIRGGRKRGGRKKTGGFQADSSTAPFPLRI